MRALKEVRAHFIRQSPEGGQFTSGGGSLLRSQVSGGTLYYVAKCPGGCLLRSRVSGGHSTTGVVYFVTGHVNWARVSEPHISGLFYSYSARA